MNIFDERVGLSVSSIAGYNIFESLKIIWRYGFSKCYGYAV